MSWQLTIDAHDPHALADFWAAALGGELEDNAELIARVLERGWAQESDTLLHHGRRYWRDLVAVQGAGPRLLFQRVPEDEGGARTGCTSTCTSARSGSGTRSSGWSRSAPSRARSGARSAGTGSP